MLGAEYSTKFSPFTCLGMLSPRLVMQSLDEHERKHGASQNTYWVRLSSLILPLRLTRFRNGRFDSSCSGGITSSSSRASTVASSSLLEDSRKSRTRGRVRSGRHLDGGIPGTPMPARTTRPFDSSRVVRESLSSTPTSYVSPPSFLI
jgi:hypothetical protein